MRLSIRPQPRPHPSPWPWLLGTRPHSRQWEAASQVDFSCSFICISLPAAHITAWTLPPVRSVVALDSHRSVNPATNYKYRELGCTLLMKIILKLPPPPHPTVGCGQVFFYETSPWCQKKVGDHWSNKPTGTSKDTKFKTWQSARSIFKLVDQIPRRDYYTGLRFFSLWYACNLTKNRKKKIERKKKERGKLGKKKGRKEKERKRGRIFYQRLFDGEDGLPRWGSGKESTSSAQDTWDVGSVPVSERSSGGGNGNPLRYYLPGEWTEAPGGL